MNKGYVLPPLETRGRASQSLGACATRAGGNQNHFRHAECFQEFAVNPKGTTCRCLEESPLQGTLVESSMRRSASIWQLCCQDLAAPETLAANYDFYEGQVDCGILPLLHAVLPPRSDSDTSVIPLLTPRLASFYLPAPRRQLEGATETNLPFR